MKSATSELSLTIVAIIAIAAILGFVTGFLPDLFNDIRDTWNNQREETEIDTGYNNEDFLTDEYTLAC